MSLASVIDGICSAITAAIPGTPAASWSGNLTDLLAQRSGLPALRVRYQGASYTEQKFVNVSVPERHDFQVLALDADLGSVGWTTSEAAELLVVVEAALRGLEIDGGRLWPVRTVDLLPEGIRGAAAYGLTVRWEIWR